MQTRLLHLRDVLKSSYWFLPLLFSLGAVVLARVCLAVDRAIPDARLATSHFLYVADIEAIRTMLITVATVTLATVGVVLSLTTVPFTVAAPQFGSRLLRNFLRDTLTQIVLGAYFATFLYCVVVLFSLPNKNNASDLPYISTTVSLALALSSFVLLVFFINNIGVSLQAPVVVAEVSEDLTRATSYYARELCAQSDSRETAPSHAELWGQVREHGTALVAERTGYAQALDVERLTALATQHDAVIAVDVLTGQFVVAGDVLAYLLARGRGKGTVAGEEAQRVVNKALYLSVSRIPTEDVEFAVNQLVEIAMRALSPAINDPFTAMLCLDRLSVGLSQLAGRIPLLPSRADAAGQTRVLYHLASFAHLCDRAFHQIRQYGRGNADVLLRLLDALERIAFHVHDSEDRAVLLRHVQLVDVEASGAGLPNPADGDRVRDRARQVREVLSVE